MNLLTSTDLMLVAGGTVIAGMAAGLLAGLLGVGGGLVIVPMLFWVFTLAAFDPALAMPVAVASSLATIVATSISSARAHHRRGSLDVDILRRWSPWMAAGALTGGAAAGFLPVNALLALFGCVALAAAVIFALRDPPVIGAALPVAPGAQPALATAIGALSAMIGIGGGTLSIPVLTAFSVPVHRAIGTSAGFGLLIAVPGTLAFALTGLGAAGRPPFSVGYVNLVAVALILPGSVLMAPVGARLAHALPARRVRLAFAVFLAITALRMLFSAFR